MWRSIGLLQNIFSYRKELYYVSLIFLFILSLPVLVIITLTNTGIEAVSYRLASFDTKTHKVAIHDPASGKVIAEINAATSWPLVGTITLEFGEVDLPYQPLHTGIDIATRKGDPITPFMKGKVIYADEIKWGYGRHIIIDNGNNLTTIYAHLNDIYVKKGDEVKLGDVIGAEGSTGWSTGPHLHLEVRVFGLPVNPRIFLQ